MSIRLTEKHENAQREEEDCERLIADDVGPAAEYALHALLHLLLKLEAHFEF